MRKKIEQGQDKQDKGQDKGQDKSRIRAKISPG